MEYLRVKQTETGHELTVSKTQYDFAPDGFDVIDKPATDAGNNPLPPKHKTSVSASATAKKAGSGHRANSEGDN